MEIEKKGFGEIYPEHQEWLDYPVQDIKIEQKPLNKGIVWIQKTIAIYGPGFHDIYKVLSANHYFHLTFLGFTETQEVFTPHDIHIYSGTEKIWSTVVKLQDGDVENIKPGQIPLIARKPGDDLRVEVFGSVNFIDCTVIGWESPIRYHDKYPIR